jgi:hypothetical protein
MLRAWLLLAFAIALHVTDEALTGFLPVYNETVQSLRLPLPTFTFAVWITGLAGGVLLMLAVAPAFGRNRVWTIRVAWVLGILMVANAIGHTAGTVYFARPMPGFWSSPLLLAAALGMLNQARMSGRLR